MFPAPEPWQKWHYPLDTWRGWADAAGSTLLIGVAVSLWGLIGVLVAMSMFSIVLRVLRPVLTRPASP